jgi:hypothetical protein
MEQGVLYTAHGLTSSAKKRTMTLHEPVQRPPIRNRNLRCTLPVMKPLDTDTPSAQRQDKQLHGIALESVLEKRRLDQALNAKEFAVCAGVSYSTARSWFHLPGFPVFRGVTFWQDFVRWRADQNGSKNPSLPQCTGNTATALSNLPPRASQILHDA